MTDDSFPLAKIKNFLSGLIETGNVSCTVHRNRRIFAVYCNNVCVAQCSIGYPSGKFLKKGTQIYCEEASETGFFVSRFRLNARNDAEMQMILKSLTRYVTVIENKVQKPVALVESLKLTEEVYRCHNNIISELPQLSIEHINVHPREEQDMDHPPVCQSLNLDEDFDRSFIQIDPSQLSQLSPNQENIISKEEQNVDHPPVSLIESLNLDEDFDRSYCLNNPSQFPQLWTNQENIISKEEQNVLGTFDEINFLSLPPEVLSALLLSLFKNKSFNRLVDGIVNAMNAQEEQVSCPGKIICLSNDSKDDESKRKLNLLKANSNSTSPWVENKVFEKDVDKGLASLDSLENGHTMSSGGQTKERLMLSSGLQGMEIYSPEMMNCNSYQLLKRFPCDVSIIVRQYGTFLLDNVVQTPVSDADHVGLVGNMESMSVKPEAEPFSQVLGEFLIKNYDV